MENNNSESIPNMKNINEQQMQQQSVHSTLSTSSSQELAHPRRSYFFRGRRWSDMTDEDSSMSFNKSHSKVATSSLHDGTASTSSRWRLSHFFRRDGDSHKAKVASTLSSSSTSQPIDTATTGVQSQSGQTGQSSTSTQFPEGFVSMMHFVSSGASVPSSSTQKSVEPPHTPSLSSTLNGFQLVPPDSQTSSQSVSQNTSFNANDDVPPVKKISPAHLVQLGLPILQSQREYSAISLSNSFQKSFEQSSLSSNTFDPYGSSSFSNFDRWALRGSTTTWWSTRRREAQFSPRSNRPPQEFIEQEQDALPNEQHEAFELLQKPDEPLEESPVDSPATQRMVVFQSPTIPTTNQTSPLPLSPYISDPRHPNRHVLLNNGIAHRLSGSSVSKIQFGVLENSASFFKEVQPIDDSSHQQTRNSPSLNPTQFWPDLSSSATTVQPRPPQSLRPFRHRGRGRGGGGGGTHANANATHQVRHLLGIGPQSQPPPGWQHQRPGFQQQHQARGPQRPYQQPQHPHQFYPVYNSQQRFPAHRPQHIEHQRPFQQQFPWHQQNHHFQPRYNRPHQIHGGIPAHHNHQHHQAGRQQSQPWNMQQQQRQQGRQPSLPPQQRKAPPNSSRPPKFALHGKRPPDTHQTLPVSEEVKQYRMRQIAIGKSMKDYRTFFMKCPKDRRTDKDPMTPRCDSQVDCGRFNNELLQWKRLIRKRVEELGIGDDKKNEVGSSVDVIDNGLKLGHDSIGNNDSEENNQLVDSENCLASRVNAGDESKNNEAMV